MAIPGHSEALMSDVPHFVAWIDYLIASDDPEDQALATEYRTQSWAMRELVEAKVAEMAAEQIAGDWLERMESQQRICDRLTHQVFKRAQIIAGAGGLPADEATVVRDWRARATGIHLAEWPEGIDDARPSSVN